MEDLGLCICVRQGNKKTNTTICESSVVFQERNYLSLPLMFVKRTTKENHNVNVDRVETGDENEEADGTTNVSLTMCFIKPQSKFLLCTHGLEKNAVSWVPFVLIHINFEKKQAACKWGTEHTRACIIT